MDKVSEDAIILIGPKTRFIIMVTETFIMIQAVNVLYIIFSCSGIWVITPTYDLTMGIRTEVRNKTIKHHLLSDSNALCSNMLVDSCS